MEFTEEEKREIDRKLAMADEDMKNGRFYTNEESKKIINDWIRRLDYIYDNQTKNSSLWYIKYILLYKIQIIKSNCFRKFFKGNNC